jgi:hypothetical protein
VIAAIVLPPNAAYRVGMRLFATKLFALLAVLLMPFGMASAQAAPIHHEHMMAMPIEHCPEKNSPARASGALADCAMACATAVPAADLLIVGPHAISRTIPKPSLEPALSGVELEIATPPPRRS